MIRNAIIFLIIALISFTILAQVTTTSDTSKKLHDLFNEDWQWVLKEYPLHATVLGDNRYNDRLTDLSFEAIERRKVHEREMLARIRQVERSQLFGQDLVSYDLFLRNKQVEVEGQRFPLGLIAFLNEPFPLVLMPLSQSSGPHLHFPKLADEMPFRNVKDYENYLARLAAFPKYIDQVIALMKRGMAMKWVPPAVPLRSVPAQIEGQIVDDATKSPLYKPFEGFPREVSQAERSRLTTAGQKAVTQSIIPALRKLNAFIKETYLPACRQDIAASSLSDGLALYGYFVRRHTTTTLSPREIHEIGKSEVTRIRKEMEATLQQVGFEGSFPDFLTFLRTDARFYYMKSEELVMGYRDICKRADAELPKLFAKLPRNPYGVRDIPAYEAPAQTTAYYERGAADGSRAGYFWVNTYKLNTRPKYEMEALALHEAVPGHHLQISRAQELKSLPDFRRNAVYTAYVEGWGLYAESLGTEMGFYSDPYSKFGQLSYEMWRACRLVVDTGMHALGWGRQQAIEFMKENTGKTENDIIVEVDRYLVWPGQALAYKMGELKIKELRAKARKEFQEKFDIRKFHNALLDDGPLPLDLLEKRIDDWISEQKPGFVNQHTSGQPR